MAHPPTRRQAIMPATGMPMDTRPNRNIGTANAVPATNQGQSDRQTEAFTYFTKAGVQDTGTPILYNGDRLWAKVTLVLETAGPVAVSTRADLFPVLSGKGELLTTNVPMVFTLAKGFSRLYIAATGINRVKVQIEPFPWIEQITGGVDVITQLLRSIASR